MFLLIEVLKRTVHIFCRFYPFSPFYPFLTIPSIPLHMPNLEVRHVVNSANDGLWTRGLLIRRRIADGDLAFFTTWCPAGTSIETLVAVEGHRWAIEDSFETAKNEFGLDHNESR